MARVLYDYISSSSFRLGYVLILISAVLAALVHVLAKPLLDNQTGLEMSPVVLAACVYIINAAFFTPLTKKSAPIASLGKRNLGLLAIIGVSEVIALITYFFGLKESTATNASIFSNGEIIFSLLITVIIFKENLQKKEIGPFTMIILGMIVLPVAYDIYSNGMVLSDLVMGDILIIASGVFYAIDVMLCQYLSRKVDTKRLIQIVSLVSGALAVGALIAFNIPINIDLASLGPIAVFAIGGTGFSTMLFVVSLRLIGGMRTMLLFSTNSVIGVIFAAIMLGESITAITLASVALTFGGVVLLRNRLGSKHEEVPKPEPRVLVPAALSNSG
ncbi:MAG: DMT family transporter [Candidatus Nitrosotenuis sp.]